MPIVNAADAQQRAREPPRVRSDAKTKGRVPRSGDERALKRVCVAAAPNASGASSSSGAPATSAVASSRAPYDVDLSQFLGIANANEQPRAAARQLETKRAQFVQELLFSTLSYN